MITEQLEFSVTEEWAEFEKENSWAYFIPETAKDSKGIEYLRRKGSEVIYKKVGEECECTKCGSEIMGGIVTHPIWDSPIPLSGSGKVHREEVPYCPKYEGEPNFHGDPIDIK